MSTHRRIYLDHNATSPLGEAARAAIAAVLGETGNPSSVHAEGRRARDRVERARAQVAALAGRPRDHVVFTSGGTEANQLGVLALAELAERAGLPRAIATSRLEHPSLAGAVAALVARGWTQLEPGAGAPGVLAIGLVNHELGTIADAQVIAAARAAGALVHVDAVQAAGKLALAGVDADALALSAHKLGGPQGAGALVIARDDGLPVIAAGHQERGRRPGTENVLGIVGFGAAAAAADPADWPRVAALGDEFEAALRGLGGVRIHGDDRPRVGGTINAGFSHALGESIVIALDLAGIATSTGAACTSGSIQPSPVLLALGLAPDDARAAVRFSLGRTTTRDDLAAVLAVLPAILERARRYR